MNFFFISNAPSKRKPQHVTHPLRSVRVCWRRRMSPPSRFDDLSPSAQGHLISLKYLQQASGPDRHFIAHPPFIHPSIAPTIPAMLLPLLPLSRSNQIESYLRQFSLSAASAYVCGLVCASVCICTYTCNEIKMTPLKKKKTCGLYDGFVSGLFRNVGPLSVSVCTELKRNIFAHFCVLKSFWASCVDWHACMCVLWGAQCRFSGCCHCIAAPISFKMWADHILIKLFFFF